MTKIITKSRLLQYLCCCLLFCFISTSALAQEESNNSTVTITIEMTDADGNTTVKKIVETGAEEMSEEEIQVLIDEQVGDFQGNLNVNVNVETTGTQQGSTSEENVEVTVDEDGNVFINGEAAENMEGANVIVIQSDDTEGMGDIEDMLIQMDVDVDIEQLIEDADGEETQIRIVKKIIESEERTDNSNKGFLGVYTAKDDTATDGVKVLDIVKDSGAEKAGLQTGDLLKTINGEAVHSHQELIDALAKHEANQRIQIGFVRGNEAMNKAVVLGERKNTQRMRVRKHGLGDGHNWKSKEDAFMRGMKKSCEEMTDEECMKICGMSKEECMKKCAPTACEGMTKEECIKIAGFDCSPKPRMGVTIEDTDDSNGVYVDEVATDSPAKKAGLMTGDIITKVDNIKTNSADALIKVVGLYEVGDKVKVQYLRNGKKKKAKMTLEAAPARRSSGCCSGAGNKTNERFEKRIIILKTDEEGNIVEEIMDGNDMGINNTLKIETLDLYPNPTEGNLNIKFQTSEKAATNIKILNVAGNEVFSKNIPNFTGQFDEVINLKGNVEGIYLLTIQQGDKTYTEKIILN